MVDTRPASSGKSAGSPPVAPETSRSGVEIAGLEMIAESERRGRPTSLFWPWFAANVSVFGISYGSYLLGFSISFWQATLVGVIGIVVSFLLVGVISLAGKRGSAPTMVLSRAMFGVRGARAVSLLSWVLTVGWETVLTVTAVFAVDAVVTVYGGDGDNPVVKLVSLVVIAGLIVLFGVFGFHVIMRLQLFITIITGVATIVYLITVLPLIDFAAVSAIPDGSLALVIGGFVFMMTGFGLGWVNAGADYSRYLPRNASSRGVVWWTTFGAALPPVVLLVAGMLLAGSSADLSNSLAAYSIGPLTTLTAPWFIIPFAVVVVLGLIGGAVMDIYSSGLSLLATGLKVKRPVAAGIDGVIMILGSIYMLFFAGDFLGPFQGFLITIGVPIAAWCGIFVADVLLRKRDFAEAELYDKSGRYGDIRWSSIVLVVVATVLGWGFVTNGYAEWLGWQGYLLDAFGIRDEWGGANLGVLLSLLIGFVGYIVFSSSAVRRQENR